MVVVILQTIITAQMMSTGGEENSAVVTIRHKTFPEEATAININPKYLHCNLMMVRRHVAASGICSRRPRRSELVQIDSRLRRHLLRHVRVARAIVRHAETHPLKRLLDCRHKCAIIYNYYTISNKKEF